MLQIVLVTALTGMLTVLVHHEGLLWISERAGRLGASRTRLAMAGIVTAILMLHVVEIALYAGSIDLASNLLHLGRLAGQVHGTDLEMLYFSAETYTSLGFGDIVPTGPMRLLASFEPLNGLLMLGWSATFIHVEVDRFWRQPPLRENVEAIGSRRHRA